MKAKNYKELISDLKNLKSVYPSSEFREKISALSDGLENANHYSPKLMIAKTTFFLLLFSLLIGGTTYVAANKSQVASEIVNNIQKNFEKLNVSFNSEPELEVSDDTANITASPVPTVIVSQEHESENKKNNDAVTKNESEQTGNNQSAEDNANKKAKEVINTVLENAPEEAKDALNEVLGILNQERESEASSTGNKHSENSEGEGNSQNSPTQPINIDIEEKLPINLNININLGL